MSANELPYHVKRKLQDKQIDIIDEDQFMLKCRNCNATWKPESEGRVRLPKGYWHCPNGCNEELGEKDSPSQLRLLLVDDDIILNRSLSTILRNAGYDVVNAFNGKEMLEEIGKRRYDAVIMDIRLPDISGVELLRLVRESNPVIGTLMLSGAATLEDAVEALNHGADAFIIKPVNPENLLYRLGTITGFKRLEKELREARARYNELFTIIHEDR